MVAAREIPAYITAHQKMGSAKGRTCVSCLGESQEWAFLHKSSSPLYDEAGRPYSLDPNDYAPMCISCHTLFDRRVTPSRYIVTDRQRETGRRLGRQRVLDGWYPRLAAITNATRRKCAECEKISTPGPLSLHQKSAGHCGWIAQ